MGWLNKSSHEYRAKITVYFNTAQFNILSELSGGTLSIDKLIIL